MNGMVSQGRAKGYRIVASLLVVLLAAGVGAGAFTQLCADSAALPKSMFSSGSLALAGGSVVMGACQLTPGQTMTGGVVLTNAGDAPGRFTLRASSWVDTHGPAGGCLARTLLLTVTDVTVAGAPQRLYEGSLAGLAGVEVGPLGPGALRTFRITVSFPQQDVEGSAFAGSGLSFAFAWAAVTTG